MCRGERTLCDAWCLTTVSRPPGGSRAVIPGTLWDQFGFLVGPTTSRYVGTQAVFQLSKVAPHIRHSKLPISRLSAAASVRR